MVRTREVSVQPSALWSWVDPGDAVLPAPVLPGWGEGDRVDRVRGRAITPPQASLPTGEAELLRSFTARRQQLHQSQTTAPQSYRVHGKVYHKGEGDRLWLDLRSHGRSYRAWARQHPTEARAIGKPNRVYRMIRSIRHDFRSVGSPLARHAARFVVAGYLSGYHPRFIAAFAALESGWGRYTPHNAPYNYWGWTVYTGNQSSAVTRPFRHADTAFRYFGRQLKKHYGGAHSVYSRIWAPYAADPNHERNIASILSQTFGGNPHDIRFPRSLRDRR